MLGDRRPRPWCLAAALLLLLGVARADPGEGPLPRIYFEAIADGSPVLAVDGVRFASLPSAPIMEGEVVFFTGRLADGRSGIFRSHRGVTEACVDTQTPIPGGRGAFTGFEALATDAGGRLAFRGTGSGGQQGVYLLDGEGLRRVADTSTLAPGGERRFVRLGAPAFAGRDVAFIGLPKGASGPGLYRVDPRTGAAEVAVDDSVAVPGREARFRGVEHVSGRGDRLAFVARDSEGGAGVYTLVDGTLARVVDTRTPMPDATDERFAGFDDVILDRAGGTVDVAFHVPPPERGQGGLYARIGDTLRVVAPTRPGVVRGSQVLDHFTHPSLRDGNLFCFARSTAGEPSILDWRDGRWHAITFDGMRLAGRRSKQVTLSNDAAGTDGLAFQVTFEDGTEGIYLAHLRPRAGRVVLSDPLHGSTVGEASGGRFVEGGGWTPVADNDRILWTIPPMGPNGMLEVDVRNFDPAHQVVAEKDIFMGLWGTLFANHERLGLPNTDNWEIRVGTSEAQFKIEYHARGFGKAAHWAPYDVPFDPEHTYRFRVEWRDGRMTTWVDERALHFAGFSQEPVDHFRFLHLGTSPFFGGKVTRGPIYSNVRIVSFD